MITPSQKTTLTTESTVDSTLSFTLSKQRFQEFSDWSTNLNFKYVSGFISLVSPMSGFGYYGYDSWGFLLNTYNPLRRTNFEESYLSFQDTTLTTKTATSEAEDVYSYSATFEDSDLGSSIYVSDLSWSFLYNDWVAEVCDQP